MPAGKKQEKFAKEIEANEQLDNPLKQAQAAAAQAEAEAEAAKK